MRFLTWIGVLALCIGPVGCASLNPKNWKSPGLAKRAKGERPREDRIPPEETASPFAGRQQGHNGLLAGQVIDSFNQRQAGAMIQVTAADASPNEPPQEAAANEQGYFTIRGLQAGRRYKLVARNKKGEQVLAGSAIATPPNAVILIKISEDFANSATPGIPGPADLSDKSSPPPQRQTKPAASIDARQGLSAGPKYLHEPDRGFSGPGGPSRPPAARVEPLPNAARLGNPIAPERPVETPARQPPPPIRPEYMTDQRTLASGQSPTVEIGGARRLPPFPGPSSTALPLAQSATVGQRAPGDLQAPACLMNGNRIENFALNDLQGRPYQLKEHRGRLVLLDFWGTWCQPCIQALPHIEELHRRFAAQGLEVVGVAYENDGTFVEKAQRVNFVRQRQGVSYKMLLGEGDNCPVRNKLGVNAFPTLVLLDAQGTILWRAEGLTPQNKANLEAEIQKRLAAR